MPSDVSLKFNTACGGAVIQVTVKICQRILDEF